MAPETAMQVLNHFDMTVESIQSDVAPYASLSITDFADPKQLQALEEGLRVLQKKRTSITNAGKAWREASNAYNKAVLAIEKELLSHVLPVEEKLKKYQSMAQLLALRETNKTKLFDRQTALKEQDITLNDDTILEMTDEQFEKAIQESVRMKALKTPTYTLPTQDITLRPHFFYDGSTGQPLSTPFPEEARIEGLLRAHWFNRANGDFYMKWPAWISIYRRMSFIPKEDYEWK